MNSREVDCCIAGGGPAGMVLGWLLARSGVRVLVAEKHDNFLRDFRGDTIHPSILQLMTELGCDAEFLKLPHTRVERASIGIDDKLYPVADFSHLPVAHRFIAFMPQWDFLDFISTMGQREGGDRFSLMMGCEAVELMRDGDHVTGLVVQVKGERSVVSAALTVAADGRDSVVRRCADLPALELGAPMDVLWFKLGKPEGLPEQPFIRLERGAGLVLIDRGNYFQCGYIVAKGTDEAWRQRPIEKFQARITRLAPVEATEVSHIADWEQVSTLRVQVDRLNKWYLPGLLCIGDAAHAMSPVGGIGINIAVQDAVAAARLLAGPLREGKLTADHLQQFQDRREPPARRTQAIQVMVQNRLIRHMLQAEQPQKGATLKAARLPVPLPIRLMGLIPVLRRIPARFIGLGVQPESLDEAG